MDLDRSATPYTLRHVDAAIAAGAIGPGDRVLDVGCGLGRYTVALARRNLTVEGMDLTPALVDRLRQAAPGIVAHVGDLAAPPAALAGRFDVVTGFFVLHHVADLPAAFRGVRALLRPGGRAVFVEPNPLFPGYYVQITVTPGMSWKGDGGIVRMRPGRLAAAASAAGLEGFATERFGAFPPFLANRPAGGRAERALEAVPGWRPLRAFQLFSMHAP
jgi:SAM-dependent methyltransferase